MHSLDNDKIDHEPQEEPSIDTGASEDVDDPTEEQHGSEAQQEGPHHPQPVHVPNCKVEAYQGDAVVAGGDKFGRHIVQEGEVGEIESHHKTVQVHAHGMRVDAVVGEPQQLDGVQVLDHDPVDVLGAHEDDEEPEHGQEYADQVVGFEVEVEVLLHKPHIVIGGGVRPDGVNDIPGTDQVVSKPGHKRVRVHQHASTHRITVQHNGVVIDDGIADGHGQGCGGQEETTLV